MSHLRKGLHGNPPCRGLSSLEHSTVGHLRSSQLYLSDMHVLRLLRLASLCLTYSPDACSSPSPTDTLLRIPTFHPSGRTSRYSRRHDTIFMCSTGQDIIIANATRALAATLSDTARARLLYERGSAYHFLFQDSAALSDFLEGRALAPGMRGDFNEGLIKVYGRTTIARSACIIVTGINAHIAMVFTV